jgi:hypothetical protein
VREVLMDADRLAEVAVQLVARVRDDDPISNGRWLQAATSFDDRWALLFVLAAAVPVDVPWRHLTAWTVQLDNGLTVPRADYPAVFAERFGGAT